MNPPLNPSPNPPTDPSGKLMSCITEKKALVGCDGLHITLEHQEHGEPANLDFLDVQLGECSRVISQSHWIKRHTGVQLIWSRTQVGAFDSDELHITNTGHKNELFWWTSSMALSRAKCTRSCSIDALENTFTMNPEFSCNTANNRCATPIWLCPRACFLRTVCERD